MIGYYFQELPVRRWFIRSLRYMYKYDGRRWFIRLKDTT